MYAFSMLHWKPQGQTMIRNIPYTAMERRAREQKFKVSSHGHEDPLITVMKVRYIGRESNHKLSDADNTRQRRRDYL